MDRTGVFPLHSISSTRLDSTQYNMAALLFIRQWDLFNVGSVFITKWSETVVMPLTCAHNSFTSDKCWLPYHHSL